MKNQSFDEEIDEFIQFLGWVKEQEKERYDVVRKIKALIREWRESKEMEEYARDCRLRYLKGQEKIALEMFQNNKTRYVELMRVDPENWEIPFLIDEAKYLVKRLESCQKEREARQCNRKDEITPEMVERAREYPIEQIVKLERNGRAKCVFHGGEDGNMDIRKNFAHCYVCQESGDAIDVYRAVHGVGFREAVMSMQ